jgi:hypothetical protein
MKDRLTHWPSTIPALLCFAFLALAVWLKPELLDKPETLLLLGGGVVGLFWKASQQPQ